MHIELLIKLLQQYPPTMKVVIAGEDNGFEDINILSEVYIKRHSHDDIELLNCTYGECENDDQGNVALFIG